MDRRCQPDFRPGFAPAVRNFDPDASIALVGIRGTGRSTLAVMASSALGFRLLDADQHFFQTTGLSRATYKARHGAIEYRGEELRLMRSMLFDNPKRTVIACGPGAVEDVGRAWLSGYARSHPVIYILRDAEEIKKHLRVWETDAITRLIYLTGPTHRSLSNFEFYNISDSADQNCQEFPGPGHHSPRTLALKRVENDFLRLIFNITRRHRPESGGYQAREGPAALPPEHKPFTYSLTLPMSVLDRVGSALRNVNTTVDVAELVISLREMRSLANNFDNTATNHMSRQFYAVKRYTGLPVVIYIQPDDSSSVADINSSSSGPQSTYYYLLNHGLRLAPEYLCIDLSCDEKVIRDLVAAKGTTKIIGHHVESYNHAEGWSNPDLRQKMQVAKEVGCDIVRICREARSVSDNFEVQRFIHEHQKSGDAKIPLIAYNAGRLGRMSCFMSPTLTPVTDVLIRAIAPEDTSTPLLTIEEAQKALYSSFLLDPMYFGIYGVNVSKSLSPAMHNAAFKSCGMPHEYKVFQHPTLNDLRTLVSDENFGGASITAPFKKEVFALVDFTSPEAQAIGAVNTLVPLRSATIDSLLDRNRRGPVSALYGDNTDWIGIHACIRGNLSPINGVKRRTTALIVGAGGMARAAVYSLFRLGVRNVFIHNRTPEKAEEIMGHFQGYRVRESVGSCSHSVSRETTTEGVDDHANSSATIKVIPSKSDKWPQDADYPTIIVSCVHTREIDGCSSVDTSLPEGWFASPTGGVVIELSYTPLETPLLKQVRAWSDRGWIAVDGLKILPEQGMRQFEIFTARKAPIKVMREEVPRAYKARVDMESEPVAATRDYF